MPRSTVAVLLAAFLVLLSGCQTRPADPPIAGEWSEPVNGVRMMAKLVEQPSTGTGPEHMRAFLIFTTNVSDRPVFVPSIQTEIKVHRQFNGNEPMEMPDTANNLRIVAEDMNKQRSVDVHPHQYQELQSARSIERALEPGEVRVHVLYLMLEHNRLSEAMQQLSRFDSISSSALTWATHVGEPGEYRLHLTYRPDGFYEQRPDRIREIATYEGWQDKQIVLTPITVTLYEDDFRDEPIAEERNAF